MGLVYLRQQRLVRHPLVLYPLQRRHALLHRAVVTQVEIESKT